MHVESTDFKIAFINLKTGMPCYFAGSSFTLEHIGVGYLTSVLREHGYDVTIIDAATRDITEEEIIREVLDFHPSMVGFSPTVATMESAIRIGTHLKEADRMIHICLGGHHATFLAERILKQERCFDSVVRGEGELTIVDLADRLRLRLPLDGLLGLYFRSNGIGISRNPCRDKIVNLDSIPFPARDTLRLQIESGKSRTARVISSRGCIADCSFCSIPPFERLQSGRLWRARSPENVLDELTILKEDFGVNTVLFAEDNFIGPGETGRERVRKIAEGMISRRLEMHFRILTTSESLIDCEPLLPLLKKAGLDRVIVGIESASPSTLKIFQKRTTLERHYKVVEMLSQHHIVLHLGFIMFHPYATIDDLRQNAEFLERIDHACFFQYFSNRMELYPGVTIFEKLHEDSMILSEDEYRRSFLYKYAEPRIEKMARALSPIRRKMADLDKSLLDMDIWITEHNNNNRDNELSEAYKQLRKRFSYANLDFFLQSVENSESGWDSGALEDAKSHFLNDIENLDKELRVLMNMPEVKGSTFENKESAGDRR